MQKLTRDRQLARASSKLCRIQMMKSTLLANICLNDPTELRLGGLDASTKS
jgi:hypothetical protein